MALALRASLPPPTASEHELVTAVRGGDERAFEELFSRYRSRISAYVLGVIADHSRAEDITQDVFISALRRLRETECPVAFKPWIYEIARNACIDEFRRARRSREIPLEGDDDAERGERQIVSRLPSPDAAVESKQQLDQLCGAFSGLSEQHHRVLILRELEGLSYEQIGEQLGMSRAIVESTLFRARKRLGEEFEELASGRRCQQIRTLIDSDRIRTPRLLGIRARRQLARHLSHCQDCRRLARIAGVDESLFKAPRVLEKLAALFPFGWLRLRRGGKPGRSLDGPPRQSLTLARTAQSVGQLADPASAGIGRAAAAAAALILATAGGGVVALSGHAASSPPRHERPAAGHAGRAPAMPRNAARGHAGRGAAGGGSGLPPAGGRRGAGGLSPRRPGAAGTPPSSGGSAGSSVSPNGNTPSSTLPQTSSVTQTITGAQSVPTSSLPSPKLLSSSGTGSNPLSQVTGSVKAPNTPQPPSVQSTVQSTTKTVQSITQTVPTTTTQVTSTVPCVTGC
jgi:RNA polymerase sigma factor (sigma-70 family)